MDSQQMLEKLGALKDVARVERVYGEPHVVGERTIIPVAEVHTCMGMGFGSGKAKDEEDAPEGEGGGGGGSTTARPVGVVEVTSEATTFIPIKPAVAPWKWVLLGLGLGLLMASGGRCNVNVTRTGRSDE
jgi:uncharacterized spore protein YtfJ